MARALLGALALLLADATPAQGAAAASGIYTCTDDHGRKLTSDRPIAACMHKEQLLLNRDGSVRAVIPPTFTAEERAEREARERRAAEMRAAQQDAVRRDRNLVARFPNEEAHAKAREAALDSVRLAMAATERRLKELAAERVPLANEAEFYVGRPLPPKIKTQLDANDAAVEAQKAAGISQAAELERVNKIYDAELERLRRLWGGAQPGSLGPMPVVAPAPVVPGRPGSGAAAAPRPVRPGASTAPMAPTAASGGTR
ncbi:MAG: DUF4124 domain-containing protein [Rubrivivax sp.]|nr:DUF4124 domain-containing protein [Rubrivivax sp.]